MIEKSILDQIFYYLEDAGWQEVDDRGMSENNGYLFSKVTSKLYLWTVVPRLRLVMPNGNQERVYEYYSGSFEDKNILLEVVKAIDEERINGVSSTF